MSKVVRVAVATMLLSSGLAAGLTSSAEAASNCPSSGGLACYYDSANYAGSRGVIPDSTTVTGPCQLNIFSFTTASSLYNNSINTQTWYTTSNYGGSSISVSRQSGRATLSSPYNNNIRSWKGTCYGGARVSG